jgi:phosphonoacetate hydrolase
MNNTNMVTVNGRSYRWPHAPTVVICCDGSDPAYTDEATTRGLMPNLARFVAEGAGLRALSVIPSFTNPNNLSIVTGRPPAVHGICGNYFFDRERGEEVMMNDPGFLRAPTIFEAFQKAGAKVAVVTAKDKLRLLLGHKLKFDGTAVSISSERADQCTLGDNGIDDVLDMELGGVGADVEFARDLAVRKSVSEEL